MNRPAPPFCAKFAVVIDPGTLMQRVDSYHANMLTANEWAADVRIDHPHVDVMRVMPLGTLTKNF